MRSDVPFYELWLSTESLHNRFYPDRPPGFDARWRVYAEETAEFQLEAIRVHLLISLRSDQTTVAKECADVIVTAMGLLMGLGIGYEQLENAVMETIKKNDAKTLETHLVRPDGKIVRRKEVTE